MAKGLWRAVVLVALAAGCAGPSVRRLEEGEEVDLTGHWNDSDSRAVAQVMMEDCLSRPWLTKYKEAHEGKLPVVTVGRVRNISHEHISEDTFLRDLQQELLNSGEVEFVSGDAEREQLLQELGQQGKYASDETFQGFGKHVGANYMLLGTIDGIDQSTGGKKLLVYKVTLELHDIATTQKVWIKSAERRKLVSRPAFSFVPEAVL